MSWNPYSYDPASQSLECFIREMYYETWWIRTELDDLVAEPDAQSFDYLQMVHGKILSIIQTVSDREFPRAPESVQRHLSEWQQLQQVELWCINALKVIGADSRLPGQPEEEKPRGHHFDTADEWVRYKGRDIRLHIRDNPGQIAVDIHSAVIGEPDDPAGPDGLQYVKQFLAYMSKTSKKYSVYCKGPGYYMNEAARDKWHENRHNHHLQWTEYHKWIDACIHADELPFGYHDDD